jgi:hypothetical protein
VFADIAKMWIELSIKHIIPGINFCDRCLELANDKDGAEKLKQTVRKLQDWSNTASTAVGQLAAKVRLRAFAVLVQHERTER